MSVIKKSMLAALVLTGFGVNIAHANSVTVDGAGVSATADVVIGATTNISNTLTPVSGLPAGDFKDGTKVADGTIHSLDSQAHLFDVRFGPEGTNLIHTKTFVPAATFTGKNNSTHKITLRLAALKGAAYDANLDNDNYGLTLSRSGSHNAAKTVGYQIYTQGDQPVEADTYTISTVAYTYSS